MNQNDVGFVRQFAQRKRKRKLRGIKKGKRKYIQKCFNISFTRKPHFYSIKKIYNWIYNIQIILLGVYKNLRLEENERIIAHIKEYNSCTGITFINAGTHYKKKEEKRK